LSEMTIFLLPSARSDYGRSQQRGTQKSLKFYLYNCESNSLTVEYIVTHKKTYDHKFNEMFIICC